MFHGVGCKFVQGKADRLSRLGRKRDLRPAQRQTRSSSFRKERQLLSRQVGDQGTPPVLVDKEIVGRGQTLESLSEPAFKFLEASRGTHRLSCNRLHNG